jgi:hypothetical protein
MMWLVSAEGRAGKGEEDKPIHFEIFPIEIFHRLGDVTAAQRREGRGREGR